MGVCEDGSSAMGCGDQTEFRNCADVAIEPLVTSGYIVGPASRSVIAAAADSETGETNEVDKQLPGDDVLSLDCGGQWVKINVDLYFVKSPVNFFISFIIRPITTK